MLEISDFQKIGLGLAAFGVAFLMLGVMLLFDKGLLAVGNILFISGLAFIIGLERTFWFFFQKHKWKASLAFFSGITVVLIGWPLIGMIFESYGFVLLFRGFFPAALSFLTRVPVLGTILSLPLINKVVGKLGGDSRRSMV
jgi:hypothetical protein